VDKYEEAARGWYNNPWTRIFYGGYEPHNLERKVDILSKAFRWYEERREKATCETCKHRHLEPRVDQGKDELTVWCLNEESEMWDVQILHEGFGCNKHEEAK